MTEPKLVLVAEDNRAIADLLGAALADTLGAHSVVPYDGEAALRAVQAMKPAVVLLDIRLPRIDSLKVARRLKADPETRAIPIVALTALSQVQNHDAARAAACGAYVATPCDIDELARVVRKYLKAQAG